MSNWLVYCVTVTLVVFSPGPMTIFAMTNAIAHGRRVAVLGILGGTAAYSVHIFVVYMVMTNLIAMEAGLLKPVRWLGGIYFLWLGYKQFGKQGFSAKATSEAPKTVGAAVIGKGFLIAISNPKAIVFFAALFPQFIDASSDQGRQFLAFGLVYLAIQFASNFIYSWFGEQFMQKLHGSSMDHLVPKFIGALLVLIGLIMLI